MRIAFNPSTVAALTTPPNNKDITFDLKGRNIFARGVKFYGTDTNTWRPVVDNLTSNSTTSSLSANQGRVLKALIDGKSDSGHNHDGRYVRYYAVTTLDCNNLAVGLTAARVSATNAAHTNNSVYLYISDIGTPFQIQIPDSNVPYIYKRYYSSGKWSGWFKLNAGYADSAGSVAWANITGKPSSYTPSAHTHAWNSLTHSSTTENQAILTNGKANGWKLYTLNISGWNNAANNAHSHSNKSVLDGITSGLVSNWNTAYTFVHTITGTDTDKVINKWDEIVNFLAGITEDNKLNTLLNNKLSVYKLADETNVGIIKNNGIYYSTTDASSGTLTNSPFNTGFALINMTSYDGGDDLRRSRLAFNAYGEIKVSDDRGQSNTAETWYNVLTSKNSGISGSTIKLNGTSITVYSSGTADGRYVKKSGDTMTGVLTINTTSFGALTIKRNDDASSASIQFRGKSSVYGYIGLNNSTKDKQFLRWNSDTSKFYTILDTSSTYTSSGKGVINGTTITQVDNATNATNSTNARKLVNWYSARPTSLNAQFGDGSLRIFYATPSTTEGKSPADATVLHLAWDNNGGWDSQLAIGHSSLDRVYLRSQNNGTWQPWKTLAFTTDIPSSLKNPYSFNVFGVTYDGSAARTVTTSTFVSQVNEATATVTDGTMLITSYTSNSGFADTNAVNVPYKRKAVHLWEYIKTKTDSLYATKSHNHDGRYVYNYGGTAANGQTLNQNALFMSTTSGITGDWWHILQAAWNGKYCWNSQIAFPTQNRNGMYYRSGLDDNTKWGSWVKLLDVNNYSSTLDSRYYTESEVNSLLSNKLNTSNFNWTNLPGKIVAGSEFNIVSAGFKEHMWFNYLPINDRSKTATISGYHFGNGARGYTYIIASGFIKSGGNASQLLRADGGVAAFNWSGQSGQPTWLWGGNSQHSYYVYNPSNFRVAYAASAGNADTLDSYHESSFLRYRGATSTDQETTLWGQIGIKQYNKALPDDLTNVYNYGSVISLPGSSSRFEIYAPYGASAGNGLYYRSGWGNDKKSWCKFIDSSNIGSQTVTNAYHLRINSANSWSTWNWVGQSGQPSWLWGSNDGTNMYVWNPGNFRVAYASSAGNASTLGGTSLGGLFTAFGNNAHNITATIGGVTKSFLVNWAADSDKLDGKHASDFATAGHNHDGRYLRLDGSDTMKGVLHVIKDYCSDRYDGAINMNNSDIYGLNSIYTSDKSESQAEGIHFWRDKTHVDTLRMMDGKLLFTPNRLLGSSGTELTVLHTGNSSVSGHTITINGSSTTWSNTWRPIGTGASDAAAGNHTHKVKINGSEKIITATNAKDVVDLGTYLTSHQSLAGYVNTVETIGAGNAVTSIVKAGGKITANKGTTFLTSHQSLANYYTKGQVDAKLGKYLPLAGGTMNAGAQIQRTATGGMWYQGRSIALLRETSANGYHALWSLKTTDGSWDFGEYNSSGWNNIPVLSYVLDSNFNKGSNTTTYQIKFPLASGTIALTSNITNYYWANNKITSTSKIDAEVRVKNLGAGCSTTIENTIMATNWVRAMGNTGIYFQDHGGGLYMSDNTWIRTWAGKALQVDNTIRSTDFNTTHYANNVWTITSAAKLESATDLVYGTNTSSQSISTYLRGTNVTLQVKKGTSINYNALQLTADYIYCNNYCDMKQGAVVSGGNFTVNNNSYLAQSAGAKVGIGTSSLSDSLSVNGSMNVKLTNVNWDKACADKSLVIRKTTLDPSKVNSYEYVSKVLTFQFGDGTHSDNKGTCTVSVPAGYKIQMDVYDLKTTHNHPIAHIQVSGTNTLQMTLGGNYYISGTDSANVSYFLVPDASLDFPKTTVPQLLIADSTIQFQNSDKLLALTNKGVYINGAVNLQINGYHKQPIFIASAIYNKSSWNTIGCKANAALITCNTPIADCTVNDFIVQYSGVTVTSVCIEHFKFVCVLGSTSSSYYGVQIYYMPH